MKSTTDVSFSSDVSLDCYYEKKLKKKKERREEVTPKEKGLLLPGKILLALASTPVSHRQRLSKETQ